MSIEQNSFSKPASGIKPLISGSIVILNGAPRSGKSSIAAAIQESFDGVWMNLGVDQFMHMTPKKYQPGIGLRPGGERPDLEELIVTMYRALYESIAALSKAGLNVVADVGHHDGYSVPRGILSTCAEILKDLPVLFVGVRCPLEEIMRRRELTGYRAYDADGSAPAPVLRWQQAVHEPGLYDLEVDTSVQSPEECALLIQKRLKQGPPPSAFARLTQLNAGKKTEFF